jgi:hypothetical protein
MQTFINAYVTLMAVQCRHPDIQLSRTADGLMVLAGKTMCKPDKTYLQYSRYSRTLVAAQCDGNHIYFSDMQDGRAEKLTLTACHESILVLPCLKFVEEKYINLQKYLFYLTGKLQNLNSDKLLVTQKESFKKHLLSKENAKTKLHHLTNNIQKELLRKYRGLLLRHNSKTWIFVRITYPLTIQVRGPHTYHS